MRKNIIQDERVLAQKRKIGSEACQLLMIFLLASVLVQQYVFNAPFASYAVEFIGFFGAAWYIVIRNIIYGNDLLGDKKNKNKLIMKHSLVTGVTITVVAWFINRANFPNPTEELGTFLLINGTTFTCAAVGSFAVIYGMAYINKKRILKIEKQFEDEDE